MREKYNLIQELSKKRAELKGIRKLSLIGQGDFPGANNVMRAAMNIKHHIQHLTIDNPEFPYVYEGKENLNGEHSSFYKRTDKAYRVTDIVKKYDELLKGKAYIALYFLHCDEDDSWIVVERKEVENLTENFGFTYNNEFLDNAEIGETIPKGTVLYKSTSYDDSMNVSVGVNALTYYGIHPAVQDDAIIISESFAKRMVTNQVSVKTIPIGDNTVLLNLYGDIENYQGFPDIGSFCKDGILAATRTVRETKIFSDLRDSSLSIINQQSDQVFYSDGEVIDINVYCNNPNIVTNKVNRHLLRYQNDCDLFYSRVYKICKHIIQKSGSTKVSKEVNRWMRKSMDYLDKQAEWAFNDNVLQNIMVEILVRKKTPIKIGRKLTGRHGNKTVSCTIWPDSEMPYITSECYTDSKGAVQAKGAREYVEIITNPLAIINRTIPMAVYEPSITFILGRVRKHAATLETQEEQFEFMFSIMDILSPKTSPELRKVYNGLSPRKQREFVEECIALDHDGKLITNKGLYVQWEAFNEDFKLRDAICEVYEKYGDIIKPYHVFTPKPKWNRDIYIGEHEIGYQYMMMLKQSGERGFSVRSAGAISDESLPEKSHENKIGRSPHSETPIRFGEYELPNFMIITAPEDYALITALYRSSVDGRRFMYEAILDDDESYTIPDNFTSRTAQILEVYMKSLGVRMRTVINEDEFIGEPEHDYDLITHNIGGRPIICTSNEMYILKKLAGLYKSYISKNPNNIVDYDDAWEYCLEHLPFKKKKLTDDVINLFRENLEVFTAS